MKGSKLFVVLCFLALAAPQVSHAIITFSQLAENIFVVSHRVKFIGSRGQAMRLVYTKAASLCVAAGFSHMEIVVQESDADQLDDSANASVRVKFYMASGEDRLDCEKNSNPEHTMEARNKLAKMGYQPPDPQEKAATAPTGAVSPGTSTGTCTIEQIVAMVEAGLGIEQIKAACPAE